MFKLYYHTGSGNHGCEAIVRSTAKILNADDNLVLYSSCKEEDERYGLGDICNVVQDSYVAPKRHSFSYLYSAIHSKLMKNDYSFIKYGHKNFFDSVSKDDICFSIGGDNYCYGGIDKLAYYNKALKSKKAKTVLWGCSVEPEVIDDNTAKDFSRYDLIFARESLSYTLLKSVNKNTYLFPDPAFQLDFVEKQLPDGFVAGNTVGINISPLILSYEADNGLTLKNYINLIDFIIKSTNMQIALIPHVVKNKNDDRAALKTLYDLFANTGRVVMLEDCNCMELKGFIKRCRFVITARTHASIAAYSTCVPTLVAGYSIKSKGIATDIFGTYDNYVLPVQELKSEEALTDKFKWLMKNEDVISSHLKKFMPDYCKRALMAGEKIKELLG